MRSTSMALLIVLAGLIVGTAQVLAAGNVQVEDAWVREGPPTAQVLAAFLTVHNGSDTDIAVVGASSPAFERIELHRTVIEEGVARMIAQDRVEIPAGSRVTFEPGGRHLMLFDPRHPLAAGDELALAVELEDGSLIETTAQVRRMTGEPMGQHHHHH